MWGLINEMHEFRTQMIMDEFRRIEMEKPLMDSTTWEAMLDETLDALKEADEDKEEDVKEACAEQRVEFQSDCNQEFYETASSI